MTLRAPDCAGPVQSEGYLHIGTTGLAGLEPACKVGGSNLGLAIGGAHGLGPLADNGGVTATHAVLGGSVNLDPGGPAGCEDELGNPLDEDQRGAVRIDRCDRGAYEAGADLPIFADGFETGGPWLWSFFAP